MKILSAFQKKGIQNTNMYFLFIVLSALGSFLIISSIYHNEIADYKKTKIKNLHLAYNAIRHGNSSEIDIRITSNKSDCEIEFCDNGKGIPDEIKDKIFEEGYTHGESGNTGIGLYIVRQTIQRYNGSVIVKDNKPNGTIFVINLRKAIKTEIEKRN